MTSPTPVTGAAPATGDPQGYFDELVAWAATHLTGAEVLLASFAGEVSDFVRVNGRHVRQAGTVSQGMAEFTLVDADRQAGGSIQLSQQPDLDRPQVQALIGRLRDQVAVVPADPYLSYSTDAAASSQRAVPGQLPDVANVTDQLVSVSARDGIDLVGIYAAGVTYRGFASSLGQRNWHQATTFNLDWSQYLQADKAVKSAYAGSHWSHVDLAAKLERAGQQLAVLARQPITLKPDTYRAFLSPAAMVDILGMMAWGGFSLKANKTAQSPLLNMVDNGATLNPAVTIREDTAHGMGPNFQSAGFRRPDQVPLIVDGAYGQPLVSPRSAKEYQVETNGAEGDEEPESITVDSGAVATDNVVAELGEGLYVGNLWYLNFSDRSACRTTGMTRFATFWVQGGEIVAPVNVMRFDDTAYSMLGTNLLGLTDRTETILDPMSYGGRSTTSYRLPGALVEDMAFTL